MWLSVVEEAFERVMFPPASSVATQGLSGAADTVLDAGNDHEQFQLTLTGKTECWKEGDSIDWRSGIVFSFDFRQSSPQSEPSCCLLR